jgi:hypothetical protein
MSKKTATNHLPFAWQPELRPAISTVYGPPDYRLFRDQLLEIDRLLRAGIEAQFVREVLSHLPADADAATRNRCAKNAVLALRCNIARKLTGLAYRAFAVRAAESHLLHWFLGIASLDMVSAPSKSTLERFDKILSSERMEAFNRALFATCIDKDVSQRAGLSAPVDFTDACIDATCLKAGIHFPVDWVLLRDAARTLMKAVACIRRHGLRNRMPQKPQGFLGEMNKQAMAMSACARRPKSKKTRKQILRQMKKLSGKIDGHARAHLRLLRQKRERTDLSEKQAGQIARRIENILEQLPAAIKQAHERIIGGRQIKNAEKILSLYQEASVMVRGKAGAQVEIGHELLLCENNAGLTADYTLCEDGQGGVKALPAYVERLKAKGTLPGTIWADWGLCSQKNKKSLVENNIKSGLCERDVQLLQKRLLEEKDYARGLKRRGATEARIAIIKKCFTGNPSRAKGREHIGQAVGWAVLTHNVWVLARREQNRRREQDRWKAA